MLVNSIQKTFQYGAHTVTLETGTLARQATAAVLVRMDDTVVLVTVVCTAQTGGEGDFFPLTVHYQERSYAGGRIPGSYFKREGRPTEREILISRLIDRPFRPLFPKRFCNEVQIIATVLSSDPAINADIPALLGASAALAISGLPCQGPIAAARVGYINGQYTLNPTIEQLNNSELELIIAGTETAVLMVESEAAELSEEVMLEAVLFGHLQLQSAIDAIKALVLLAGKPTWKWSSPPIDPLLEQKVSALVQAPLNEAYQVPNKLLRKTKLETLRTDAVKALVDEQAGISSHLINQVITYLEEKLIRHRILAGQSRIDGRDTRTVRPITVNTALLPRTHGSALFTRGETQALVVVTLGTDRDAQLVDALEGEGRESFMLHYNFPPYSVGETGQMGSTKRREVGHGNLAKRALKAVLPSEKQFPHVLRVVSEITESNGSSSMATVCGASLALMDAGVPLKKPVAGIAMGLIKEDQSFVILSDILGDEDYLGDMDFKVAGTVDGITALQMDIKIDGITQAVMAAALQQAKEGRLSILNIMNAELASPRVEISPYAPKIITLQINPAKIRTLIGKGGATIRNITEETGTLIDISDNGVIRISTPDAAASQVALERIKQVTADIEIGDIYEAPVIRLTDFGAIIALLPGREGFLHISQISDERIECLSDVLVIGQVVRVKIIEIDRQGRVRVSMKSVDKPAVALPA